MKTKIQSKIKAVSTLFVLPLTLFSCQSEQEVGTPLYPTSGDEYTQVAFVDNHAYGFKNLKWTTYARAGASEMLDIPADTLKFDVKLTMTAEKDLTFKLKIDNSKVNQDYIDSYAIMDEEAVKIENGTVTVKKGQMKSEQPFKVVLNEKSKSLLNMDESKTGVIVFTFESADGVKISEKYNAYSWELYKEVRWVNPNGSIEQMTPLDVNSYKVFDGYYGSVTTKLSDNDKETVERYYITSNERIFIKIDFNEETEFSAIQLTPGGSFFGDNLAKYFMKEVEILGSADGNTYTKLGTATCPAMPTEAQEPWNIVFYSTQKVKHLRIRTISTFESKESNQPVFLTELKFLK